MEGTFVALEDRLREAARGAPSIAWGVWQGGRTLALGAAGGTMPRTPYALASITKPMTATAIVLLAERGKVDLDAPISDYLETPLAGDARGATVRRVLNHTAGLPLHYQFFYADEPFAPPPFAETIRRYGRVFSPPGTRFLYSNLGYGLLDSTIERVSGRPYADFMREEIFGALGMAATIGPSEGAAIPMGDGFAYPPYGTDHPGGSAAFASVEDLLRFGRFHLGHGPSLLSRAALASMRADEGYGLGWGVDSRGFFGHTGSMGGVRTAIRLIPSLDAVLVALSNGEGDLVYRAVDEAHVALDPSYAPLPPATPTETPLPQGRWRARVETHEGQRSFDLDAEHLLVRDGRLTGTFDGDVGTLDAGRRAYRLHLDLAPVGDGWEGAVAAISTPGLRQGNALSYRCVLGPRD